MTDIDLQPLTPAVFHILLALAASEKHGYEIMKSVRQNSQGQVKMGNGTLYGSIKRMLADGLIADAAEKATPDARRKYYKLTRIGRKTLNAEINRYVETVRVIRNHKVLANLLRAERLI